MECKVGSEETPGVTGKFGLGVQNEVVLIEFLEILKKKKFLSSSVKVTFRDIYSSKK